MESRWILPDEIPDVIRMEGTTNTFYPSEEYYRKETVLYDPKRTLATFDRGEMVGTTATNRRTMTVPGGALPTGAISAVMVLPTHRRQGIMTRMIDCHLRDIHERGEVLAALRSSDPRIYGRFGFGISSMQEDWSIERHDTTFSQPPILAGRMRLIKPGQSESVFSSVYEQVWPGRPGMMARNAAAWKYCLADVEEDREDATRFFHAVYEVDGQREGYVLYRGHAAREELRVEELLGVTDEATSALWSYCLSMELIARFRIRNRPVDDPLPWMLANPRGLKRRPEDGIWLRLVDVPLALAGRRYLTEGRLVLEVRDESCKWNAGRFELTGGPDGAECYPTGATPDLVVSAADLGAAYMGAVTLGTLHRAGRISVRDPAVLMQADAMFSWNVQPWCPDEF